MDILQRNKILYSRACFGIPLDRYKDPKPIEDIVDGLFPKAQPGPLEIVTDAEWDEYRAMTAKGKDTDTADKKEMKKAFRQKTKDLNLLWMQLMVDTEYPLLEKTALFWHGHFATRINDPYFDQKLLHILRKNALGNFGVMLKEVSHSAAMLQFLNNKQNKKKHPNENFAREVMELFTLGRGNYTEEDIKEAARAFTGWTFDEHADFVFREGQHDTDTKVFLGKRGNFTGDDVLTILLGQKQTAVFITQKLYRYFVSDDNIDQKHIKELANEFYKSDYDIGGLLRNMLTSDWFYKASNGGTKIKAPVELLVSYQRMMPITFKDTKMLTNLQRVLGQNLFEAPNVAGWPGGKNWIDSSSLLARMRLPEILLGSKELDLSAKEPDPEMKPMQPAITADTRYGKPYGGQRTQVNWDGYLSFWKGYKRDELPRAIADYLFTVPVSDDLIKEVTRYADKDSDEEYIKSMTILLMELPEYQLS